MSDIASEFQRLMQPHIGWGQIIRRPDYTASRHAQLQKARREIAENKAKIPLQPKAMRLYIDPYTDPLSELYGKKPKFCHECGLPLPGHWASCSQIFE